MAPSVKLTYFNGRGRSEPARLLLAYGGIEYEDCRLTPAFEVELSTNIREVSQSLENAPTSAPSPRKRLLRLAQLYVLFSRLHNVC